MDTDYLETIKQHCPTRMDLLRGDFGAPVKVELTIQVPRNNVLIYDLGAYFRAYKASCNLAVGRLYFPDTLPEPFLKSIRLIFLH